MLTLVLDFNELYSAHLHDSPHHCVTCTRNGVTSEDVRSLVTIAVPPLLEILHLQKPITSILQVL